MRHRSNRPQQRDQWLFCITAVAEIIEALPGQYRVVEVSTDDVRIELHLQTGAWEILRFEAARGEYVAVSLSHHLDSPPAMPFPEWLTKAADRLESDLEWAALRSCSEQRNEILSALVKFRTSMLKGAEFVAEAWRAPLLLVPKPPLVSLPVTSLAGLPISRPVVEGRLGGRKYGNRRVRRAAVQQAVSGSCPECDQSRAQGHNYCLECGRRLTPFLSERLPAEPRRA